jgi:perosamine synthetase
MPIKPEDIPMAGPSIGAAEEALVLDALRNGWYGAQAYQYVETFEREFAAYHGRKHALMTPSCTSAIHLLLTGLGLKAGDEVLAPDCTWVASVAPVVYLGAKPVFCDIDTGDWCLSPDSAKKNLSPKTKAIIVVGLYGNMPQLAKLQALADQAGIPLIEDAAESLGSRLNERKAGSFGIASVFSFHRTKTVTTGEGGMVLIDDDKLFERCKFLRDHGRSPTKAYYTLEVTYKYMPFNLQAALGLAQFRRLDELVARKRAICARYRQNLADMPDLVWNPEPPEVFNSCWMTTLIIGKSYGVDKLALIDRAAKLGVSLRPFFYPLSSLPAFPGLERLKDTNVNAYDLSARGVNLPCALTITDAQIDRVSAAVRKVLQSN